MVFFSIEKDSPDPARLDFLFPMHFGSREISSPRASQPLPTKPRSMLQSDLVQQAKSLLII
jgi:hypothetical protein